MHISTWSLCGALDACDGSFDGYPLHGFVYYRASRSSFHSLIRHNVELTLHMSPHAFNGRVLSGKDNYLVRSRSTILWMKASSSMRVTT